MAADRGSTREFPGCEAVDAWSIVVTDTRASA